MSNYLLNIILLTYNDLDKSKECIDRIYKYTEDFFLTIVDNGSSDGAIFFLNELEKKYNNLIIKYNKENTGIIKGRNIGFKISKEVVNYEYLIFLDSDQYVSENWLESYLKLLKKYDIVSCEAWKLNKDFYPVKKIVDKNECFNYVGCGSMMMKKEVFERVGGFEDELFYKFYFEDPNFCFEAYYSGYKIGWNYNKVIEHKKHSLRLSGERKKYFMENWKKFKEKWKGFELLEFSMKSE